MPLPSAKNVKFAQLGQAARRSGLDGEGLREGDLLRDLLSDMLPLVVTEREACDGDLDSNTRDALTETLAERDADALAERESLATTAREAEREDEREAVREAVTVLDTKEQLAAKVKPTKVYGVGKKPLAPPMARSAVGAPTRRSMVLVSTHVATVMTAEFGPTSVAEKPTAPS